MGVPGLPALDIGGPVQAEVLALWLGGDGIELTGPCRAAPWYIEVGANDDPLELAAAMVARNLGEPLVVHSTSWRRSRGSVLLTFVAVLDRATARPLASVPVRRAWLARNSATGPPESISVSQVIEHGLRHLAWLVLDDPLIAERLGQRWAQALGGYLPEPFLAMHQEGRAAWN